MNNVINISFQFLLSDTYNWPKYIDDDSLHTFNYDGETGPLFWNKLFGTCGGVNQSPININTSDVTEVSLKPLQFKRFDATFDNAVIVNNGHTGCLDLQFYIR
jgi:carbonic anhydrase